MPVYSTILFVWSLDALFLIIWTSIGCIKLFDHSAYHYQHICLYTSPFQLKLQEVRPHFPLLPIIWLPFQWFSLSSTYLPIFMFIIYIILIIYIKIKLDYEFYNWSLRRKSIGASDNGKMNLKREFQLLAQVIAFGCLTVAVILSNCGSLLSNGGSLLSNCGCP